MADTEPVKPFDREELIRIAYQRAGDEEVLRLVERVADLENVLCWIHFQAAMHHLGGAFEPIHMWAIASLAHDGLAGNSVPDWDEHLERMRAAADEWTTQYADLVAAEDEQGV